MAKKKKAGPVVIERELISSPAYLKLTGKAPQVLMVFLSKRQMVKVSFGKRKVWHIANNGQIVFTYAEAESKYGIGYRTFSKAIGQLILLGFIDIAAQGIGIGKAPTLYAISERWRKYGQPDFDFGKRAKRKAYRFPKGAEHPKKKGQDSLL